jgi:probable rRNA maturation factor
MLNIERCIDFDFKLNERRLEDILEFLSIERDVELILCGDDRITALNSEFRGIDSSTDVLSFPIDGELETLPLGSVVISMDRVEEVSKELGHSYDDEVSLLFIHALLHLLGYDHEVDGGEMREMEKRIINTFSLPKSLILRSE